MELAVLLPDYCCSQIWELRSSLFSSLAPPPGHSSLEGIVECLGRQAAGGEKKRLNKKTQLTAEQFNPFFAIRIITPPPPPRPDDEPATLLPAICRGQDHIGGVHFAERYQRHLQGEFCFLAKLISRKQKKWKEQRKEKRERRKIEVGKVGTLLPHCGIKGSVEVK
jgi:hypothetical protein